jgi:hypothetical protein
MSDLRDQIAAILSRELPGVTLTLPLADILVQELGLRRELVEDWHGKVTHSE